MTPDEGPKEALRRRMRQLRDALPREDRARRAEAARRRLASLQEIRRAGTILLFYPFGSELDVGPLRDRLVAEGKRLLLPYLGPAGMEAGEVRAREPLRATSYGPKEPGVAVPVEPAEIEVVIAPGLAFDRRGHRLGYGGGHYDRYLRRLGRGALRVGVAFSVQIMDAVPAEDTDERLDLLVTDTEVIDCR